MGGFFLPITNKNEIDEILESKSISSNHSKDLKISFREQYRIQKIENLEKKLANNLDENSFSELIKLKNQLNRD